MVRGRSSGAMPAVGSSSSSRRGRCTVAIAISRFFRSPCESAAPVVVRRPCRPAAVRASSTASSGRLGPAQNRRCLPAAASHASTTLRSTDIVGKQRATWNVRATPLRASRRAPARVTS
ncbi:hypothetical protein GCM10025868_09350 [Angustibacter aerolatus]|uniref:Uncharacterized protein n=1 Tax=Angustibacter aerolatus TaxID=1162965 RepID=A0ABQ6JES0_9ACTN|nr:hypothetical protein GCM10025868_09350 [Angustibacter aerolatus]